MSFKEIYHRDMYRAGLEIKKLLDGIADDATDDELDDITNAAQAGLMHYQDAFTANLSPLSLPLPVAAVWVMDVLQQYPEFDLVLLRVSATDWQLLHNKLSTIAPTYPAFNETVVRCRQRFGFTMPDGVEAVEPEKLLMLSADRDEHLANFGNTEAPDTANPLGHWLTQFDQVQSAVFLQLWPTGYIPEVWL